MASIDSTLSSKLCHYCHETKPVDAFSPQSRKCRICTNMRKRVTSKKRYREHKARINREQKAYRSRNKELIRLRTRTYNALHRTQKLAYDKAYRVTHRAQTVRNVTAWLKAHPEKQREKEAKRRARLLGAPVNDLTAQDWQDILAAFDHRCAYCAQKFQRLTQDHLTPLSRGGSHTKNNVVPACRRCNSRKNVGPPLQAVQPLLL